MVTAQLVQSDLRTRTDTKLRPALPSHPVSKSFAVDYRAAPANVRDVFATDKNVPGSKRTDFIRGQAEAEPVCLTAHVLAIAVPKEVSVHGTGSGCFSRTLSWLWAHHPYSLWRMYQVSDDNP